MISWSLFGFLQLMVIVNGDLIMVVVIIGTERS
jgi:hypothetical protein